PAAARCAFAWHTRPIFSSVTARSSASATLPNGASDFTVTRLSGAPARVDGMATPAEHNATTTRPLTKRFMPPPFHGSVDDHVSRTSQITIVGSRLFP